MQNGKHDKILGVIKIILILVAGIILAILVARLLPIFKDLKTEAGRLQFKDKITDLGIQGFFLILGLQSLQILVAFLPGEPIEILAGMCYGTIGGMFLIFIGAFISGAVIFFAVKKWGKNFIRIFLGQENMKKIEQSKFFQDPDRIEMVMLVLFLIPGTPKDFLIYIAGLLPLKPMRFLMISTFARFPSVISSTFAGERLTEGNWKMAIITYAITFLITGIGIGIHKRIEKRRIVDPNEITIKNTK